MNSIPNNKQLKNLTKEETSLLCFALGRELTNAIFSHDKPRQKKIIKTLIKLRSKKHQS